MWIVMTSSGQVPASCRGNYRKVALVKLTEKGKNDFLGYGIRPPRIDERHASIKKIVQLGSHNVGKTDRGAYQRTLAQAEAMVARYNAEVEA